MIITCKQPDLAKAFSTVGHAVSSRSTLPILANILLATEQGGLKLSATNLEIGITCLIDAEIQEEGSTTVPAKLITDLVNSQPATSMDLSVADSLHTIKVKSPRSSANIKGMNPSEFPLIPSAEGGEAPILLDTAQLKEVISEVTIAAAEDDSRPVLTGVHIEIADEKMTLAAADSFRLAVRVVDLPGHKESHDHLLIPARTLQELARILPTEGTVQMIVTPNRNQVLFHTERIDLVSRLIEGTFPNFRGIIPQVLVTTAIVETKEFAAAVKSVAPFARDSSNIMRLKLDAGIMTLEATAEDVGDNVSTVNASIDGPEQQIIFNVKYLADVLSVIETPTVAVELQSGARPGVIRPVGKGEFTYVIMPMSSNR